MIWTEETPISVANLNDMEMRIATALANMDNGKAIIAAAIQAMGQSATSGLTFAQLADKIKDISKDADAATGNVLTGKTFYQGGVKRTGTMPSRTGHVNAQSISRSGTTLRLRPPEGYFPGDSGNSVQINDPDFVAGNIKKGVDLFGLTGTYAGNIIKSMHRGSVLLTTSSTQIQLPTSIDVSKCVPRVSYNVESGTPSLATSLHVEAYITADRKLTLAVGPYYSSMLSLRIEWEVVEYGDDVQVQSGSYSGRSTSSTVTQSITSVDTSKSQLIFNYRWGADELIEVYRGHIRGRFASSTSVEFANPQSLYISLRWYVVTYP